MKNQLAIFDLDGTLLDGYSVLFFLARRQLSGDPVLSERLQQLTAIARHAVSLTGFESALAELSLGLRGVEEEKMWQLADRVFARDLAPRLYPEARELVEKHQQAGDIVAIISSASQFQVEPVARELGIQHVFCTQLGVSAGKLTGMMDGPACYGPEKLRIAEDFAAGEGVDLSDCYFYSDGKEDLPLLETVGHPRPTNPDRELEQVSRENDWPVQHFASRGIPGLGQLVRTGLVYGSLIPSFLAAAPSLLSGGTRRSVTNTGFSLWGDFGSTVAGLELEVEGEEHLWSRRPAVFVFNHQSAVDALILARLLRQDFTGLAKQEMKSNPLLGPVLSFAEVVFIDREKPGPDAIRPAIEKLKAGISIVVAPEGRRSDGRRLGMFRRGAFNIAMQAGVPVIPIVIENASDALPRSALVIRPACIRIKVLPPVSTRRWRPDNLDQEIDRCRQAFLEVLGQDAPGQSPQ